MTTKEKKELFRKLNECRTEIISLKTTLNEIDEQKENWFNKKEKHFDEIEALINKVKEHKNKRNSLTKDVKNDKKQREKFNEDIKKKISQVREFNKKKQEFLKKHNIKEDPSRIKDEMEKLEFRIETNVMPFDREKELMKRIKELKKKYEQSKEIRDICEKIFVASKEIDNLKREARDIHKRIQSRAKESQVKHEGMLKVSNDIDGLKIKEKSAFERFMEFKKKFNEVNEQLKNKLPEMNKLKEEADKYNLELKKKKKEKEEQFLKSKEDIVKEKIKTGKKLTTEDLLIFQSQKE